MISFHLEVNMETAKRKFPLGIILITFFVILFFMAVLINPRGGYVDPWVILMIMAVFGLIGAVIGGVLGGIIGLIGKLFKKHSFLPGLKYGAEIGFMGLIVLWFMGCWLNGSAMCIAQ
jgi:uncharacterized membrane protein